MKNIVAPIRKLFFVVIALLLLSIQSPAAYRHKKANTCQQPTAQRTSNSLLSNENAGSVSDGSRHLQTHPLPGDDKQENRRNTYAKLALFFGAGTIVSYLIAVALFFSLYGTAVWSVGFTLALLGFGLFGLVAGPLCALAALIFGLLGMKSKKHKKLAVAGLLMGVLAFIAATIILFSA